MTITWWKALRMSVALVWLYQGLWHKLLVVDSRHLAIVASVPSRIAPRLALGLIGAVETGFGLAMLFRWRPRTFAWLQLATLIAMNGAGIAFAGDRIVDIPGMLFTNLVFALAIWGLARHDKTA